MVRPCLRSRGGRREDQAGNKRSLHHTQGHLNLMSLPEGFMPPCEIIPDLKWPAMGRPAAPHVW